MATYRGLDGLLALGGALTGTPLVKTTLVTGATELNVTGGGSTLTGVLCLGDVFRLIGGETYSPYHHITTSCYAATGTAILATIPFEPGVGNSIPADTTLTVQANSMLEAKLWSLTAEQELLDSSVFGDSWRTFHATSTLFGSWSGRGEAYLDFADTEQASLINAIASPANLLANPLNFSNWTVIGTPALATNQADPFDGVGAYLLTDNSSTVAEGVRTTAVFTTDGEKSASFYVKEGSASGLGARLITSASTNLYTIQLTWVNNKPVLYGQSGGGSVYAAEKVGSWGYLIKFSVTPVSAAATNYLEIVGGGFGVVASEGNVTIYGAKACDAPFPGDLYPPQAPTVAMLFAVATGKQFYGYAKLSNLSIAAQKGELVTVSFDFVGTGALRPNWT